MLSLMLFKWIFRETPINRFPFILFVWAIYHLFDLLFPRMLAHAIDKYAAFYFISFCNAILNIIRPVKMACQFVLHLGAGNQQEI